jgi:hypothetical protein
LSIGLSTNKSLNNCLKQESSKKHQEGGKKLELWCKNLFQNIKTDEVENQETLNLDEKE